MKLIEAEKRTPFESVHIFLRELASLTVFIVA
jgi:hypothetical protein